MGCRMTAVITWTTLELKGLLEDEESHVHYERAQRHLGLHPFHLTDLNAALREILTASINSYDRKIAGIILSYKNPKLLSRMGTVLHDTCHIHVDVEADFYVFRPNVGDTLKGIVNKKSQDHVGILVHKTFNATIPRPNDDENWPGHYIHVGQEVRFTVTCLNFKDRLPYIRGSFDQDYLRGCQPFVKNFGGTNKIDVKPKTTKFTYDDDDDDEFNAVEEPAVGDNDVEVEVTRKKSKKWITESNDNDDIRVKTKKKRKIKAEASSSADEVDYQQNKSTSDNTDNIEEEFSPGKLKFGNVITGDKIVTKKKKKNKLKTKEKFSETESEAQEQSFNYVQECSDIDKEFSPKKPKKLKREKDADNVRSQNKVKTKPEVDVMNSEGGSDFYTVNGNKKLKTELSGERIKRKHKVKIEVMSSETESDVTQVKPSKRMKVESNYERVKKKCKVKAEVSSSETESFSNKGNRSVENGDESFVGKIKKKYKIKAEVLTPEAYD